MESKNTAINCGPTLNSDEITHMLNQFLLVGFNVCDMFVSFAHFLHGIPHPKLKACLGTTMTTLKEANVKKFYFQCKEKLFMILKSSTKNTKKQVFSS